ncbi:hypothetical protein D3C72_2348420 [compost metagenome]
MRGFGMQCAEIQGDAAVDPWDGVAMRLPLGKLAARHTVVPEYGVYRPAAC